MNAIIFDDEFADEQKMIRSYISKHGNNGKNKGIFIPLKHDSGNSKFVSNQELFALELVVRSYSVFENVLKEDEQISEGSIKLTKFMGQIVNFSPNYFRNLCYGNKNFVFNTIINLNEIRSIDNSKMSKLVLYEDYLMNPIVESNALSGKYNIALYQIVEKRTGINGNANNVYLSAENVEAKTYDCKQVSKLFSFGCVTLWSPAFYIDATVNDDSGKIVQNDLFSNDAYALKTANSDLFKNFKLNIKKLS